MKKVRSKLHPTEIGVIKTFSLSPNDEIGEIAVECTGCTYYYNNLAELCEKWEDYEEPKQWYGLNAIRDVGFEPIEYEGFEDLYKRAKELGIAFETREEAEKAVKRLRAWKRLKDKGFRFKGYTDNSGDLFSCQVIRCSFNYSGNYTESRKDLNLLFGGEE